MKIGQKIKFYREMKGYNQSEFARVSTIPLVTLKQYEISDKCPKLEALIKISNALNVSPNVFLTDILFCNNKEDLSAIFSFLRDNDLIKKDGDRYYINFTIDDISSINTIKDDVCFQLETLKDNINILFEHIGVNGDDK